MYSSSKHNNIREMRRHKVRNLYWWSTAASAWPWLIVNNVAHVRNVWESRTIVTMSAFSRNYVCCIQQCNTKTLPEAQFYFNFLLIFTTVSIPAYFFDVTVSQWSIEQKQYVYVRLAVRSICEDCFVTHLKSLIFDHYYRWAYSSSICINVI